MPLPGCNRVKAFLLFGCTIVEKQCLQCHYCHHKSDKPHGYAVCNDDIKTNCSSLLMSSPVQNDIDYIADIDDVNDIDYIKKGFSVQKISFLACPLPRSILYVIASISFSCCSKRRISFPTRLSSSWIWQPAKYRLASIISLAVPSRLQNCKKHLPPLPPTTTTTPLLYSIMLDSG